MYAVYDKTSSNKTASFNQFQFINILPKLCVKSGGFVYGYANVYAGSQQNQTTSGIVGNSSSFLVQLNTSYSYMIAKTNKDTGITKLDFYGGFIFNKLTLKIKVFVVITKTIDTSKVFFPVCWAFDISLNKAEGQTTATYTINQMLKLMGGAKLTINKGAEATFASLSVYNSEYSEASGFPAPAYPDIYENGVKVGGTLIVNGTLNCTNFGGVVKSEKAGAKITISSTNSITTYEANGVSGSSFNAKASFTTTNLTNNAKFSNGASVEVGKTYTYDGTTWTAA